MAPLPVAAIASGQPVKIEPAEGARSVIDMMITKFAAHNAEQEKNHLTQRVFAGLHAANMK